MLTLAANAQLERGKARDARELESVRLASEHARWLRDERVKVYAGFSLAGEEVLQFIRWELPTLIGVEDAARRDAMQVRWAELRTELRKAYNQVALFGADTARAAALGLWRTARNGGNNYLRQFETGTAAATNLSDSSEKLKDLASSLGTLGDRFLEVCRGELQADRPARPATPVHKET